MSIIKTDFKELGYIPFNEITLTSPKDEQNYTAIKRYTQLYETLEFLPARYIRSTFQTKKCKTNELLKPVIEVTSENFQKVNFEAIIKKLKNQTAQYPETEVAEINSAQIAKLKKETNTPEFISDITLSIITCKQDYLSNYLIEKVCPSLFSVYPTSKILVFLTNHNFETLFSIMRGLYTHTLHDLKTLKTNSFQTLNARNKLSTIEQPRTILTILQMLSLPDVRIISTWNKGLYFVILLDPPPTITQPQYPGDWIDIVKSGAAQYNTLPYQTNQQKPDIKLAEKLVNVFIKKYNKFIETFANICQFNMDNYFDPKTAFEINLSIDKALTSSVLSITSNEASNAEKNLFEVADILEEICLYFNPKLQLSETFKKLFHPQKGLLFIVNIFSNLPDEVGELLMEKASTTYNEMKISFERSLTIKENENGNINIKEKDLKTMSEKNIEDLIPDLMRQLRNSHHGYKSDKQNRSARFLSITDGNITQSIAWLAPLWILAMVSSPEQFFNVNFLPSQAYE
jgi:hypothetical protein